MPAVALFASFSDRETVTAPELVVGHDSRTILADKAYGRAAFRELLESVGLQACIPPPKAIESSPAKYHRGFYSKRHYVENFFQRIKEPLAIATRYEKLAARLLDLVKRTANCDWFKK